MSHRANLLFLFIFFILPNLALANHIEIKINSKNNQKIEYYAKITNIQNSENKITNNITEFNFSYKLLENSEDGLLYSWKIDNILNYKDLSGISRELQRLNEGLEIKFFTSEIGEYKAVENWAEILEFYESKLLKLKDDFWGDESAVAYINSLKSDLLTPEKLSEFLLGEINLFHNFYGAELTLDKSEINNLSILDEFMGIKLPVINESKLTKNNNNYYLVISEKIDQLRSNAIIKNEARKFDAKPIQYSNSQLFEFEYNNTFEILKINFKKEIEIGEDYMNKIIEIKRIN